MQNQFQTEEPILEQAITPTTALPAELTNPNEQDAVNHQAVRAWLAPIQHKVRRDKIRFWGLYIFFQASIVLPIASSNVFPIMRNHHFNLAMLAALFAPAAATAVLALSVALKKPRWNADELMRVGGVDAFGTLLELLSAPKRPKQMSPIYVALTKLLPQVTASDAANLTLAQRKMLRGSLQNAYGLTHSLTVHQNYRLAILAALDEIGEVGDIPIVERLANGSARTDFQKELKAAAIACLPRLREKFGNLDANKTLLRASSIGQSTPDTLLRAVEFVPDSHSEQLLHATETPPLPPSGI